MFAFFRVLVLPLAMALPLLSLGQVTATFSVDMPQNRMSIDAGPDQHYNSKDQIILGGEPSAHGGSGQYFFEWSPAELLSDPHSANPRVIRLDQSTYFKLTVLDIKTGCRLEDEVVTYYPNKKSNITETKIELFPNPFQEMVQFSSNEKISELTVLDLTGRMVYQEVFNEESSAIIQTERFNSGIYLFQFKLTNGTTKTLKLCKAE